MKRICIFLPALILLAAACKQNPKQPEGIVQSTEDSLATGNYLPVADFIRNDIARVDSFAGGIVRKVTVNGRKKDSSFIQLPVFHQLANQFLLTELDSASFHAHFKESSLMDETSQMMNFIYSQKQPDWPLRNVMVYVKPGVQSDKVDRVYMERDLTSGDTAIQQKFSWKMQEYFYIITMRQPKNGPAVISMEKVIWDPQHFGE
jgi:hypothetical protein